MSPLGASLQVNMKVARKPEGKMAAPGGGDEKGATKSSSVSKPTPGKY